MAAVHSLQPWQIIILGGYFGFLFLPSGKNFWNFPKNQNLKTAIFLGGRGKGIISKLDKQYFFFVKVARMAAGGLIYIESQFNFTWLDYVIVYLSILRVWMCFLFLVSRSMPFLNRLHWGDVVVSGKKKPNRNHVKLITEAQNTYSLCNKKY